MDLVTIEHCRADIEGLGRELLSKARPRVARELKHVCRLLQKRVVASQQFGNVVDPLSRVADAAARLERKPTDDLARYDLKEALQFLAKILVDYRVLLLEIAVARAKGPVNQDKLKQRYRQLLDATGRVVGQAKRFSEEIVRGVKRSTNALKQLVLEGLRQELDEMTVLVKQVMKQTRARIFRGNTRSKDKLLSLFEPSTEVIRKGKAGKPNEFGKMVKLQEAENQIITDYEVYARRPNDSDLLVAAIETHQALLGRTPRLVAADAAFYSAKNETAAKAKGVKRVCIPNRSTKSLERKREQRKRWFRNGQKWRTGCEGRISVVKRRHGLDRCRYKGYIGMNRWVGLGVIADNVVNIGRAMEKQAVP